MHKIYSVIIQFKINKTKLLLLEVNTTYFMSFSNKNVNFMKGLFHVCFIAQLCTFSSLCTRKSQALIIFCCNKMKVYLSVTVHIKIKCYQAVKLDVSRQPNGDMRGWYNLALDMFAYCVQPLKLSAIIVTSIMLINNIISQGS